MSSTRDQASNPYQPPAEAIDFTEISDSEAGSKSRVRPRTIEALRETRPWVKLLGSFGLLCGGLSTLGAGLGIARIVMSGDDWELLAWVGLRLVLGLIYLMGSIFLLRYASLIGDLVISEHQDHLDAALESQKSFWRFVGISFALCLLLAVGTILFFLIGGGVSFFLR